MRAPAERPPTRAVTMTGPPAVTPVASPVADTVTIAELLLAQEGTGSGIATPPAPLTVAVIWAAPPIATVAESGETAIVVGVSGGGGGGGGAG